MAKIGIFREGIYPSGGIETWLYNLVIEDKKVAEEYLKKPFIREIII